MLKKHLDNTSIIIVGGTTGLGLAAAKSLLHNGANVVVLGRNSQSVEQAQEELSQIAPGKAAALVGDAVDPSTPAKAIDTCLKKFNTFDALYHVAGGSGRAFGDGPLHEVTDEGIDKTLDLNLKSLILSNRAAVQSFLQRKVPGSILNMGSVLSYSPSPQYFSTHIYAAAKAAIIGLTKSSAAYYASHDIRFNVIAPALVETPMAQRAARDSSIQNFIKTKQPLDGGRIGNPEDLDGLVSYLLSRQSRFVTGQVISVDGGWTVSEGQI